MRGEEGSCPGGTGCPAGGAGMIPRGTADFWNAEQEEEEEEREERMGQCSSSLGGMEAGWKWKGKKYLVVVAIGRRRSSTRW